MCGILGSFAARGFDVASRLELIAHRGPDGSGVVSKGAAVHGHVRLALVDLTDASAQPFRRGQGVLSFVGEIWNHKALRAELEAEGRLFRTNGDTEVLAAALERWGVDALPRLDGMFAFAWSHMGVDILARDRFGKVPLYVSRQGPAFMWSSERKGLGRHYPAVALQPGSVLDMRTGQVRRWYTLPDQAPSNHDLFGLLEEGVKTRLNADAPLCCLISGGLDSSLILTIAKRRRPDIVAYTAVLDEASADLRAARRICSELSVKLVEVKVRPPTPSDLAAAVAAIEIPSKAQVEIAALCLPLAQAIASDGFKACLSGEAADELFGGYGNMCIQGSSASSAEWRAIRVHQLEKMARGNFVRCNKAFMAHGVECRLPYMHRPLVERVIAADKFECPPGKKMLKKAAQGLIPGWVITRVKDTFQGGSGMADAAERSVDDPAGFYRAETNRLYGASARD